MIFLRKLVIIFASALFLLACSSADDGADKNGINDSEQKSEQETTEQGIEVDKGLMNVEITLPEMFFEDEELADIEKEMEKNHEANVTKNEDGSITVKMSKKEHKQLLNEMSEEFIETIDDIIADNEFISIKDISYNRDFSEMNIFVDRGDFENSLDGFALFSLGFSSLLYQLFDGKDIEKDKVTMFIVDDATGDVFEEVVYPDVFDEIEELMDE